MQWATKHDTLCHGDEFGDGNWDYWQKTSVVHISIYMKFPLLCKFRRRKNLIKEMNAKQWALPGKSLWSLLGWSRRCGLLFPERCLHVKAVETDHEVDVRPHEVEIPTLLHQQEALHPLWVQKVLQGNSTLSSVPATSITKNLASSPWKCSLLPPSSQFTVPAWYSFYLLGKTYQKVECRSHNMNPDDIIYFPNV